MIFIIMIMTMTTILSTRSTMMMWTTTLLLLSLSVLFAAAAAASDAAYHPGVRATTPVALTPSNMDQALSDAANPIWFLKFYAPWCGHCKKMAPMLEQVAPQLQSVSIGKIDCTIHKSLCNQYKVKGYPTLKFAVDGSVHDYQGGRSAQEIVQLDQRLGKPVIQIVQEPHQALTNLQQQDPDSHNGVVFVMTHETPLTMPESEENNNDKLVQHIMQQTPETQLVAQVARQFRVTTEFAIVVPTPSDIPPEQRPTSTPTPVTTLCRLEANAPNVCYDHVAAPWTLAGLQDFIRVHQIPSVTALGPNNFHAITRNGRPTVIGVYKEDDKDSTTSQSQKDALVDTLWNLATTYIHRDDYYFGYMDGGQYNQFLAQFNITTVYPQIFVFDATERLFWQNTSHYVHLPDSGQFLAHVHYGIVPAQTVGKGKRGSMVDKFYAWLVNNRPWSMVILVLGVVATAILITLAVTPSSMEEESYLVNPPSNSTATTTGTTTGSDEYVVVEKDPNAKKKKSNKNSNTTTSKDEATEPETESKKDK